jgi:GH18 family chitinase
MSFFSRKSQPQPSIFRFISNFISFCSNLIKNFSRNLTKKKSSFKKTISIILALFVLILFIVWYLWEAPLASPVDNLSYARFLPNHNILGLSNQTKIIYGFLPYWNLDKVKLQPELTHLGYFGLNISEDGTIQIKDEDGNLHPGYNNLTSDEFLNLTTKLKQNDIRLEIVLVQFDADKIVKIANNEEAHQNLITSLDSILLAYPVHGINIDIEYMGEVDQKLRDNFASLVEKISAHVNSKYKNVELSIDMFATASNNEMIWDVPRIAKAVDHIVVMAYDFHRRSSDQAGPVAPLFGGKQNWDTDIHQNLREYLRYVPNEKLLLGIPFYGYEWQTESRSPQANTFPGTGATASYERVQKLLNNPQLKQIETGWDDKALSPYLSYIEDGEIYMIYYENPTSISFKLEYVKQLDLGGIAIWALGYEGSTRELWDAIK